MKTIKVSVCDEYLIKRDNARVVVSNNNTTWSLDASNCEIPSDLADKPTVVAAVNELSVK